MQEPLLETIRHAPALTRQTDSQEGGAGMAGGGFRGAGLQGQGPGLLSLGQARPEPGDPGGRPLFLFASYFVRTNKTVLKK